LSNLKGGSVNIKRNNQIFDILSPKCSTIVESFDKTIRLVMIAFEYLGIICTLVSQLRNVMPDKSFFCRSYKKLKSTLPLAISFVTVIACPSHQTIVFLAFIASFLLRVTSKKLFAFEDNNLLGCESQGASEMMHHFQAP
jgi:hypothetical protein